MTGSMYLQVFALAVVLISAIHLCFTNVRVGTARALLLQWTGLSIVLMTTGHVFLALNAVLIGVLVAYLFLVFSGMGLHVEHFPTASPRAWISSGLILLVVFGIVGSYFYEAQKVGLFENLSTVVQLKEAESAILGNIFLSKYLLVFEFFALLIVVLVVSVGVLTRKPKHV